MTERQPPEPTCKHFDIGKFCVANKPAKCPAGVAFITVAYGSGPLSLVNIPCFGSCPEATCDKRLLPVVKPMVEPVKQPTLF
jgi:hypothetical protein